MNKIIPRRTIEELVAKYTLAQNIKDIFVEGVRDKALIEWFLTRINRHDIVVYDIQTVEISNGCIDKYSLNHGSNRSRVITLSHELVGQLEKVQNIICIADKDYLNYIPHPCCSNGILKFTDYCTMELYAFSPEVIEKLVKVVFLGVPFTTHQLIEAAIQILKEIFIIRLANETLGMKLTWVDFHKDLKISLSNIITFDKTNFIKRYLLSNGKYDQLEIFNKEILKLASVLNSNPREFIMGHDLIDFFCCIVKQTKNKKKYLYDHETLSSFLFTSLELGNIENEELFKTIAKL